MATYGKKKKSMFSGFSVARDDGRHEDHQSGGLNAPVHPLKTNLLWLTKGSPRRAKTPRKLHKPILYEEDSMDELANNQLLPGRSQEPSRQSPLRHVTTMDRSPSNPHIDMSEYHEKPLPEIPRDSLLTDLNHPRKQQDRSSQASSLSVKPREERQPQPSHPAPMLVDNLLKEGFLSDEDDHPPNPTTLKRSMTEMGNLSGKIDIFVDPATPKEAERLTTGNERNAGIERAPAPSSLRRGRHVLAMASRAIVSRISRSSSTHTISDRQLGLDATGESRSGSSQGSIFSMRPSTGDDSSWPRHHRRIAEGENLGRAKIQAMISDGHAHSRSSSRQESIKSGSTWWTHDSRKSPASTVRKIQVEDSSPRPMGFKRDRSHAESTHSSDGDTSSHLDHLQIKSEPTIKTFPATRAAMSYLVVNGLAQHPNPMVFASPPRRISTPRTRVDSQRRVLSNNKSIHGSENQREDGGSAPAYSNGNTRIPSGGSMSVKRKSATRDLRSQVSLALKRTKRNSGETYSSSEHWSFGSATSARDRPDRLSIVPRERNRLSLMLNNTKTSNDGTDAEKISFGHLDSSKENEPMEDKTWVPHGGRGSGGKKSSHYRRFSLFTRGSGASTPLFKPSEDDDMTIDELQTDDQGSQMGERKK